MNEVEAAIKRFRADPENELLFLEAQAEIRRAEWMAELRLQGRRRVTDAPATGDDA